MARHAARAIQPAYELVHIDVTEPIWTPSEERIAQANMSAFLRYVADEGVGDYAELYYWSVLHPERFWPKVWSFSGVIADERDGKRWDEVIRGLDRMAPPDPELGPRWFIGSRLNFAENLLRYRDDRDAIVAWDESGRHRGIPTPACGAYHRRTGSGP